MPESFGFRPEEEHIAAEQLQSHETEEGLSEGLRDYDSILEKLQNGDEPYLATVEQAAEKYMDSNTIEQLEKKCRSQWKENKELIADIDCSKLSGVVLDGPLSNPQNVVKFLTKINRNFSATGIFGYYPAPFLDRQSSVSESIKRRVNLDRVDGKRDYYRSGIILDDLQDTLRALKDPSKDARDIKSSLATLIGDVTIYLATEPLIGQRRTPKEGMNRKLNANIELIKEIALRLSKDGREASLDAPSDLYQFFVGRNYYIHPYGDKDITLQINNPTGLQKFRQGPFREGDPRVLEIQNLK